MTTSARFRSAASVLLVALAAAASSMACSQTDDAGADSSKLSSAEDELKVTGARYMGQIASGETKTVQYDAPPNYRALGFTAKGGDAIVVTVSSLHGDAMGWITDSSNNSLAANDDANANTLDSRVTYTVPTGTPKRAYKIVFRDYDMLDATFTVSLDITSGGGSGGTCSYGGQSYSAGDAFPATDGCNNCSCGTTGKVTCTKIACVACDPDNEPNRNYLGTPQTCQTIRFTCPVGRRPFQNTCGCGCELIN